MSSCLQQQPYSLGNDLCFSYWWAHSVTLFPAHTLTSRLFWSHHLLSLHHFPFGRLTWAGHPSCCVVWNRQRRALVSCLPWSRNDFQSWAAALTSAAASTAWRTWLDISFCWLLFQMEQWPIAELPVWQGDFLLRQSHGKRRRRTQLLFPKRFRRVLSRLLGLKELSAEQLSSMSVLVKQNTIAQKSFKDPQTFFNPSQLLMMVWCDLIYILKFLNYCM